MAIPTHAPDDTFVQLLTPEGELVGNPDFPLEVTDDELRGLYRDLVLVRRVDAEATALQRQGELGLWAQLLGQEAAQVGAGRALVAGDMAFPTYREHGVAWCRGVDPLSILGLFRGTTNGGWGPSILTHMKNGRPGSRSPNSSKAWPKIQALCSLSAGISRIPVRGIDILG